MKLAKSVWCFRHPLWGGWPCRVMLGADALKLVLSRSWDAACLWPVRLHAHVNVD